MDLGLKGKRAILVGASKGIGFATARAFAAEGCNIAFGSRSQSSVDQASAALRKFGTTVIGDAVDVGSADAYRSWIASAAQRLGGCDIFVCFPSGGGGPASEAGWKTAFEVDLLGNYRGIEAALPFLEKSDAGSIVTIASTAALEEFFADMPYNAIKAALIRYSSALAHKLAPKGIRVNCVSPGPIFIEGGAWDWIKNNQREMYDVTLGKIPFGRMGSGEEVANAIAFIASPACRFMTGTNTVIDGAMTQRTQF